MAVGWIATLGAIPQLLMPLGGVIADLIDRRHLLITWQMVGAGATAAVAVLVLCDRIAVWHIYLWTIINGLIALFSRPAYKVALTRVVPQDDVRPAVAINSMTETASIVVVNGAGSVLCV
jgi:MFS family permease